jgi:hypothetical protein
MSWLGCTPTLNLDVIFDVPVVTISEPTMQYGRKHDEIGRGDSEIVNCDYLSGCGWVLSLDDDIRDSSSARASILTSFSAAAHVKPVTTPFGTFQRPQYPSAGLSTYSVTSPPAVASPSSSTTTDPILVATENHSPDEPFSIYFYYNPAGHNDGLLFEYRFAGPPTKTRKFTGQGYFSLLLHTNGVAEFHEWGRVAGAGSDAWWTIPRYKARWCEGIPSSGFYRVTLRPWTILTTVDGAAAAYAGRLHMEAAALGSVANAFHKSKTYPVMAQSSDQGSGMFAVINRPSSSATFASVLYDAAKLAIYSTRTARPMLAMSKPKHHTSGSVLDSWFSFSQPVLKNQQIQVQINCDTPTGTTITSKLYDQNGNILTPDSETANSEGFLAVFTTPNTTGYKSRSFKVKAELSVSSGYEKKTPLYKGFSASKVGAYLTLERTEIHAAPDLPESDALITGGNPIAQIGSGANVSEDHASMTVFDGTGRLRTILGHRVAVPTQIRVSGIDGDDAKTSVLFFGFTKDVTSTLIPTDVDLVTGAQYPPRDARDYRVPLVSHLAMPNRSVTRDSFADTGTVKITDIVRWAKSQNTDRVYIPDAAIRYIISNGDGSDMLVQPGDDLDDFAMRLLKEYLGWQLHFDANATPEANLDGSGNMITDEYLGMWRALPFTFPDGAGYYKNLANFVLRPNRSSGSPAYALGRANYIDVTVGGHTVKSYPLTNLVEKREAPNANVITVSSSGYIDSDVGNSVISAVDWDAYPRAGVAALDRTLPWAARAFLFDPLLTDQELMNWAAKRLYQLSTWSPTVYTFDAPAVFVRTWPDDPINCRPRLLRYMDPVRVNGVQCLVRSVQVSIAKEWDIWATYEVVTPPVLT